MGFFDKLKNIGKAIKSNIPGDIKDGINHISKDFNKDISSNIDSSSAENTIPDKFNKFPSFDGEISHVSEKETPSYILCAYEITRAGYIQQSNDRYEKENTFIIVEYIEKTLHIVFHINK